MLTEFAFTPSIFDEAIHRDPVEWSAQLERLADRMFPQGYAWPIIIANLYSGGWRSEANKEIQRIKNKNIRSQAMKLFAQIDKVLIERPENLSWPEDQLGWCLEALESGKLEPIERIVACRFAIDEVSSTLDGVRCLTEVRGAGFWSGIPTDDSPEMDLSTQIRLLRKFCVHAGFICLITPHIKGGGDDETDFAVELIRSAISRPMALPAPVFEIHTEGPRNALREDSEVKKLAGGIESKISRELGSGFTFTLTLWPKLLHRYIIAGDMTRDAAGQPVKRPRWAISMNHVAKIGDQNKGLLPADWKLLKNDHMRTLALRFCSPSISGDLLTCQVAT